MKSLSKNMNSHEKLDYIFLKLKNGMTREEISMELGYKSYRGMDKFVKRHKYIWDSNLANYLPLDDENDNIYIKTLNSARGKAREVILLFDTGEKDAKKIAREVGFINHRDLAMYMKSKGYLWSDSCNNYLLGSESNIYIKENLEEDEIITQQKKEYTRLEHQSEIEIKEEYKRILEFLLDKEDILKQLLNKIAEKDLDVNIPRSIDGILVTKEIDISDKLYKLIVEFAKEKDITKSELFEVALIEFFHKYGYSYKIDELSQT